MPEQKALPELCYLHFDKTPTVTSSGSQRDVDGYQPRALIKRNLKMGHLHWITQRLLECFQTHLLWRKVLKESTWNIWNTYKIEKRKAV